MSYELFSYFYRNSFQVDQLNATLIPERLPKVTATHIPKRSPKINVEQVTATHIPERSPKKS